MYIWRKRRYLIFISLTLVTIWGLSAGFISLSAQAAPQRQILIYTPTPGPDGRIIWIVKANETLLSISLITGIPVDKIKDLNNLTSDTIYEGQQLLIGLAGPPEITVTAGPTATPTPLLPTPSLRPGTGNLCVLLFDDRNGDSIRQEDEPSIPDGAISISNRTGSVSETAKTGAGLDAQCYENLPEGEYSLSVAVPAGYNPTTETSFVLALKPGDETYVNFGAQATAQKLAEQQLVPAPEGKRIGVFGVLGALLLVAGLAVFIFGARFLKRG